MKKGNAPPLWRPREMGDTRSQFFRPQPPGHPRSHPTKPAYIMTQPAHMLPPGQPVYMIQPQHIQMLPEQHQTSRNALQVVRAQRRGAITLVPPQTTDPQWRSHHPPAKEVPSQQHQRRRRQAYATSRQDPNLAHMPTGEAYYVLPALLLLGDGCKPITHMCTKRNSSRRDSAHSNPRRED